MNSRPKAEVLARLLQTHLAQELQQLQQPAADSEVLVVSDLLCSSDSCILPEHSSHSLPGDQPAIALHAVGVSSICSAQILLPWQHEGLLVAHMACNLPAQWSSFFWRHRQPLHAVSSMTSICCHSREGGQSVHAKLCSAVSCRWLGAC